FYLITDHAALKWLRTTKLVGRRARWIMCLDPYNFTIIHRAGRKHNNADSLFRMYEKDGLTEDEQEVNFLDLPTEEEAWEAALAGNPITLSIEEDEVEIFCLGNGEEPD